MTVVLISTWPNEKIILASQLFPRDAKMNRGSYFPLFLLNDHNEKSLLHSIISSNLLEDYDCPDGWLAVDGADHGHFISVILTKSPGFNCLNI